MLKGVQSKITEHAPASYFGGWRYGGIDRQYRHRNFGFDKPLLLCSSYYYIHDFEQSLNRRNIDGLSWFLAYNLETQGYVV